MKIKIKCTECETEFEKYKSQIKPNQKRFFCNKICESKYNHGSNNPNYNNKWNHQQRLIQSELIKSKVDDIYRYKTGSANRGKKFDKELIFKMHGHRTRESYIKHHSEETRKKIGKKSKLKFTAEYKQKIRKKFEQNGLWIPVEQIDDIKLYYRLANWNVKIFDLIDDIKQISLLNELKVFNSRTNKKGVVRDHMFSRRSGFELKVFPEILRHPANAQIITHRQNLKKKKLRYIDTDSITLETLFNKIQTYPYSWKEQELCLNLIERYKNGEKWSR